MKEKKKFWVLDIIFLTAGCILAAASIELVLKPNKILDGGVVGVSMILSDLTSLPLGIFTIVINIPFLILGFKHVGSRFLIKSGYAMSMFSITLSILERFTPITTDNLLAVAYGGVFLGIGVGLVLKSGGCLDGTEALGILINKKTSISIGQFVLLCNVAIYGLAGLLYGVESAMFSLLTYFIASKIVDLIQEGTNRAKSVMIISNDCEKLARDIHAKLGRTCTIMSGEGLISGEKQILYCVVTRLEIAELRNIVNDQEESSFATISDVQEIVGSHVKKSASTTA